MITTTSRIILFISIISTLISCENNVSNSDKMNNQQIILKADRIKIDSLKTELLKLEKGLTNFKFIGITSNGIDCIYFVFENGKFNLEFEAMTLEQIPYIDKLREFATLNHFKSTMKTYNNKPHYTSDKYAPVLRIESNSSIDEIVEIGRKIQIEIFKNYKETIYDVVP